MIVPPYPIYLLRHGQTEWNAIRRVQGALDSPLTLRGVEQARAMGRTLQGRLGPVNDWDMVASPMGRAACTAGVIAGMTGLGLRFDARLVEIALGDWDGMLVDEVEAADPGRTADPGWNFHSPNGETFHDIAARAGNWLNSVRGPTIAVCHGMFGRVVRGLYTGESNPAIVAMLPASQDGFHLLEDGQLTFIECQRHATSVPDLSSAPRPNRMEPR